MRNARRGFAMLTVLWIMTAASLLALTVELTVRDGMQSARNRVHIERATWRANACLERVRAAADAALDEGARGGSTIPAWRHLDRFVAASPFIVFEGCSVSLEPVGALLDVNTATARQFRALFESLRVEDPVTLTDRLLDWRDSDDDVRPFGGEIGTYAGMRHPSPRNGPLASVAELLFLGMSVAESLLASVLTVEPGRVSVNHASEHVLRALPGFTHEAAGRVVHDRAFGIDVTDLASIAARLSPTAADSLMTHYMELALAASTEPDAWLLVARGWSGTPTVTVHMEVRVVADNGRIMTVRRRRWL